MIKNCALCFVEDRFCPLGEQGLNNSSRCGRKCLLFIMFKQSTLSEAMLKTIHFYLLPGLRKLGRFFLSVSEDFLLSGPFVSPSLSTSDLRHFVKSVIFLNL